MLLERQVAQLVDRERLVRRVEERDRVQPLQHRAQRITVDEQPRE